MSRLAVHVDAELWLFLPPKRRRGRFEAEHDGEATLGHVVQALGIPLTEVGQLRLDGRPAQPGEWPAPGASVQIAPAPRPQPVPGERFLLDVHLGKLARRMRLLGIDTAYRNDAQDDELAEQSVAERRLLLTQDRGLLFRRALWAGGYVRGARVAEQFSDVLHRFAPTLRPWTRCTACNGDLDQVAKSEVADQLEPGTWRSYHSFARCTACGRVYWRGAHSGNLEAIVDAALGGDPR